MSKERTLRFLDPRREWLYRKLERVMDRIDKGDLPMHVKEVHLFGSFLRDEKSPTDIDILVIYDSDATLQMYEGKDRKGQPQWRFWEVRRSPARLRRCLKDNAEKSVDINICPSMEEFRRDLAYEMDVSLLIWTIDDRDWPKRLIKHFTQARPIPLVLVSPASRSG